MRPRLHPAMHSTVWEGLTAEPRFPPGRFDQIQRASAWDLDAASEPNLCGKVLTRAGARAGCRSPSGLLVNYLWLIVSILEHDFPCPHHRLGLRVVGPDDLALEPNRERHQRDNPSIRCPPDACRSSESVGRRLCSAVLVSILMPFIALLVWHVA